MSTNIFAGIPDYVRITILAQTKILIATKYFISENDKDDIIQDLLLFYLEKFYKKPIPSKEYVTTSLRHEAEKLIRTKVRRRFGLFVSLEELDLANRISTKGSLRKSDLKIILKQISSVLTDKENRIIVRMIKGKNIEEIAKELHVAKATIYSLLEKIEDFCKK